MAVTMSYEPIAVALAKVAIKSVVLSHRNLVAVLPSKAFAGDSFDG